MDLDKEAEAVQLSIDALNGDLSQLRSSYAEKKITYDRLIKEVAIFDEKIAFAEMGVYEPHFDFNDSEAYKRNVEAVGLRKRRWYRQKRLSFAPQHGPLMVVLPKARQ